MRSNSNMLLGTWIRAYRVENNILITDQPSAPREEKTYFQITDDGKLEWECPDGRKATYVRVKLPEHFLF